MNNDNIKQINEPLLINPFIISLILGGIFVLITMFVYAFHSKINLYGFSYNWFSFNIFIFFIIYGILLIFIYFIIYIIGGGLIDKSSSKSLHYIVLSIMVITLIITFLPSIFVKVFENSIGYFIVSLGLFGNIREIFNYNTNINSNIILKDSHYPMLSDYKNNTASFILTLFDSLNFNNIFNEFNKDNTNYNFYLNSDNDFKEKLFRMVVFKHKVGILCWYYISSFMSIIITLHQII